LVILKIVVALGTLDWFKHPLRYMICIFNEPHPCVSTMETIIDCCLQHEGGGEEILPSNLKASLTRFTYKVLNLHIQSVPQNMTVCELFLMSSSKY